jgi:hypothetical protein
MGSSDYRVILKEHLKSELRLSLRDPVHREAVEAAFEEFWTEESEIAIRTAALTNDSPKMVLRAYFHKYLYSRGMNLRESDQAGLTAPAGVRNKER